MARGWESKSVEWQQSEADAPQSRRGEPTPEERDRSHKRESLELQRRRIQHDLDGARSDVHRAALQNAMRFLDEELEKLR